MTEGLQAGQFNRRLSKFQPSAMHVNTIIAQSGATVTARARWLARNDGIAENFIETHATDVTGTGITPCPECPDPEMRAALSEMYLEWTDESDAEGLTDFQGQVYRALRGRGIAGETFFRFRQRRLSDGLSVPLQLQSLPSEQCPATLNMPLGGYPAAPGNVIRQGIEFNPIGKRVAYHFWRTNPGDVTEIATNSELTTRVPADDVIHFFDPKEEGQIRGISPLSSSIVPLFSLGVSDDAVQEKMKVAALMTGFITRPPVDDDDQSSFADQAENGEISLEPGVMRELKPGEDVKFSDPGEAGASYEPLQYNTKLRIACGVGLPYSALSLDTTRSNFSIERTQTIRYRRRVERFQHSVVVFQILRVVWRRLIETAILSGRIRIPGYAENPRKFLKCTWLPPAEMWLDPLKDMQREQIEIEMGLKTRTQAMAERGRNIDDHYREMAADRKLAEKHGVADQLSVDTAAQSPVNQGEPQPPQDQPA